MCIPQRGDDTPCEHTCTTTCVMFAYSNNRMVLGSCGTCLFKINVVMHCTAQHICCIPLSYLSLLSLFSLSFLSLFSLSYLSLLSLLSLSLLSLSSLSLSLSFFACTYTAVLNALMVDNFV